MSVSHASEQETLPETILTIRETVHAAGAVRFQAENFKKLSDYLEKTTFLLQELTKFYVNDSVGLNNAIHVLNKHVSEVKLLAVECNSRNRIYLLLNSKKIINKLENLTKEIGRALNLFPPSFYGKSEDLYNLSKIMLDAKYQQTPVEEEIKEKIELGIQERNLDRSRANSLLILIAKAVGISTEQSELRKEYEDFKNEMQNSALTQDMVESLQIEQVVALLGKADIIATAEEREKKYFSKRNSLGRQPLEPLQSFYCPITRDVMVDPVETPLGHSFERYAIEKWLAEENNLCPVTKTPLRASALRSNHTLRQSIEEWRDRNTMIFIGSMKARILSHEDQEVLDSLSKLQDLCLERDLHQEWMMMEDYLPILISLLSTKNSQIRSRVLVILQILVKNHDDRKETVAKMDDAIKLIVCSLARKIEESKLALQVLMELSKNDMIRSIIGSSQGCILLLVTLSGSDDAQASADAKQLLENLSFCHENVVQMAKANYFGPLLHLLSSGPLNVQKEMVKCLSEVEMTDHVKLTLCESGALPSLVSMLSHADIETKNVAILAIEKLSSLPKNGFKIIEQGTVDILFEILFRESLSMPGLVERVIATIMNLALSLTSQELDHGEFSFLKSEESIFKLFSLISLNGPNVQENTLRIFLAICEFQSGLKVRTTLRKLSSVKVLVQLCEHENQTVRSNAVKLFCSLTKDGDDETFVELVGPKCINTLLTIIKTSNNIEETVSAMEIISNLPKTPQMTHQILDSGALEVIISILAKTKTEPMIEKASRALCRFTVSSDHELQKKVAETGIIPTLVHLLASGSSLTKQNVALSLGQFSESSIALTRPLQKKGLFLSCCMTAHETGCKLHMGICTVESSFCLVEANAVKPLVNVLEEGDVGACEAALDALLTLVDGELLQSGSKVLEESDGIVKIVKLLSSSSVNLQEKALKVLERIFRLAVYKHKHKASAQMALVEITQRGNRDMKSIAAKILAHLDVLHEQSSFF